MVAHLDEGGAPVLTPFVNDVSDIEAGNARLTVRHTAAAPAVDVRAGGEPVLTDLTNPNEATTDIPAGTVSADVVLAGTEDVALGPAHHRRSGARGCRWAEAGDRHSAGAAERRTAALASLSGADPSLSLDLPVVSAGVDDRGFMQLPPTPFEASWYRFGPGPTDRRGGTSALPRPFGRASGQGHLDLPAVFSRAGTPRLHLLTCGGRFIEERGSYEDNVVVVAGREPFQGRRS